MCDKLRCLKLLAPLLALCLAWAALFTTTPVGAAPLAVQVTITPPAGPAGTQFVVTGSGFTPGDVLLYGFDDPRQPVVLGQVTVSADGRFTVTIDSTGYEARDYAFHVVSQQSVPPTMPLAIVKFTVTAGAAPGLPNTGGGGGAHAANGEWPIALWVFLMSGVGLLYFRRRIRLVSRRLAVQRHKRA